MNFLFSIYHTVLFEPLFNTLVILYNLVPGQDFGVAVILVTLLVRFAFAPMSAKAVVAQRKLMALQPQAKEIQERFKKDRDRQAKELLELYKKEKVNPLAGILPILIQIPLSHAFGFNVASLLKLHVNQPSFSWRHGGKLLWSL